MTPTQIKKMLEEIKNCIDGFEFFESNIDEKIYNHKFLIKNIKNSYQISLQLLKENEQMRECLEIFLKGNGCSGPVEWDLLEKNKNAKKAQNLLTKLKEGK